MKTIWTNLWELFYPRLCVVCETKLSSTEEFLCIRCFNTLPRTHLHIHAENKIEKNFWGKMPIEKASSFLYYSKGGMTRQLLYDLKYYGNKDLGRMLGRIMAYEMRSSKFFDDIDCILPVPLHLQREKERGYNQSEYLAKGIADVTEIPLYTHLLVRHSHTGTQTHKVLFSRWEAMQGVFECTNRDSLKGKHVLLIDDVLTTGATLVAVSDALRNIEGLRISILTLAVSGYD